MSTRALEQQTGTCGSWDMWEVKLTCSYTRTPAAATASLADTSLEAALTFGPTCAKLLTEVPLGSAGAALLAPTLALAGLVRGGWLLALGIGQSLHHNLHRLIELSQVL